MEIKRRNNTEDQDNESFITIRDTKVGKQAGLVEFKKVF